MPLYYECPGYVQSKEKGASQTERNSCLKCGRTREAHGRRDLTPYEEATEWLNANGHGRRMYFEIVRQILEAYIAEKRRW